MTTQLTLISVPATTAHQDVEADAPAPLVAAPVVGVPAPQRRSAAYDGWLDGRTIHSGRKGVAAARAALADANERVATRREEQDAARQEQLVEQTHSVVRPAPHAA